MVKRDPSFKNGFNKVEPRYINTLGEYLHKILLAYYFIKQVAVKIKFNIIKFIGQRLYSFCVWLSSTLMLYIMVKILFPY